jgi:GNAT superfamily N-acetyltransferase
VQMAADGEIERWQFAMKTQLRVRRAVESDCDTIAAVHVHSWQWAYRGLIPNAALDSLTVTERVPGWRAALAAGSSHRIWLAEEDELGMGFAAWGPARDPDARQGTVELYALYLELAAAGSGVATALVSAVTREMHEHGHARATLWVLEGNARARRFYERSGWRDEGSRKIVKLRGTELVAVRYAIAVP